MPRVQVGVLAPPQHLNMSTVALLRIHPIKGLPPADVAAARVLPSGALEFDRRWALMDARGRFVNGKNFADIHRLEAQFDLAASEVTIGGRAFSLTRWPFASE